MRILTVGDGDFSCSLALKRAYGDQIDLTASTLLSSEAHVFASYPDSAPVVLRKLVEVHRTRVYYGVDATRLETIIPLHELDPFDVILFHHPHLGYDSSFEDEVGHARRHHILLAHYLHSALPCLTRDGEVHLCLCGTQEFSWNLQHIVRRLGLQVRSFPASQPILRDLVLIPVNALPLLDDGDPRLIPSPRRYRNGGKKGGNKNWLGKYGYRHQPVEKPGANSRIGTLNALGSTHYFFRRSTSSGGQFEIAQEVVPGAAEISETGPLDNHQRFSCGVCDIVVSTLEEFKQHQAMPVVPLHVGKYISLAPPEQFTRTFTPDGCRSKSRQRMEAEEPHSAPIMQPNPSSGGAATVEANFESLLVPSEANGMRLRCFLQQMGQVRPSKRQVLNRIRDGRVRVNDEVVRDSGRTIHAGDAVVVEGIDPTRSTAQLPNGTIIRVIESWSDTLHVVVKQAGLRSTSTGRPTDGKSLEDCFSLLQNSNYKSLSRLDRGCWGLSVLQAKSDATNITLTHSFVALVHGRVPVQWEYGFVLDLPVCVIRRWKGSKQEQEDRPGSFSTPNSLAASLAVLDPAGAEPRSAHQPALTTVQVDVTESSCTSSLASVISYALRQTGHPVVGDRFATQEYLTLPRGMRNRLKQKFCLGCVGVRGVWDGGRTTIASLPVPEKWKASYWQQAAQRSFPKIQVSC